MKTILITGASGFVGTHLIEALSLSGEYDIYGTVFGQSPAFLDQFVPADHLSALNLLDAAAVESFVNKVKPDYVVHLAALSSPAKSTGSPLETLTNNIGAQINLCEALIKLELKPTTLIIGSAEEYGLVDQNLVSINEKVPLNPGNPYAVSKIAQDYLGLQYFNSYGLPIIRIRPFNHTGERHTPTFVLPAFASQVAKIEQGQADRLRIEGDLEVTRDFTDVKDMVKAYILALTKCQPGEVYNIGSGRPVKIGDLLDLIVAKSTVPIRLEKDDSKQGASKVKSLVCDYQKFKSATGWEPAIPLDQTIDRVLNYYRQESKGTS